MDDSFDIYADLIFKGEDENKPEIDNEDKNLDQNVAANTEIIDKLKKLEKENVIFQRQISSLILTAKTEIKRKDRTIADLRKELDNLKFRRNQRRQNQNFNAEYFCSSNNAEPPYQQNGTTPNYIQFNYPPPLVPANPLEVPNLFSYPPPPIPTNLHKVPAMFTHPPPPIDSKENIHNKLIESNQVNTLEVPRQHIDLRKYKDSSDGSDDEINMSCYRNTIYGERLRKKLMAEKKTVTLNKVEAKVNKKDAELKIKEEPSITGNSQVIKKEESKPLISEQVDKKNSDLEQKIKREKSVDRKKEKDSTTQMDNSRKTDDIKFEKAKENDRRSRQEEYRTYKEREVELIRKINSSRTERDARMDKDIKNHKEKEFNKMRNVKYPDNSKKKKSEEVREQDQKEIQKSKMEDNLEKKGKPERVGKAEQPQSQSSELKLNITKEKESERRREEEQKIAIERDTEREQKQESEKKAKERDIEEEKDEKKVELHKEIKIENEDAGDIKKLLQKKHDLKQELKSFDNINNKENLSLVNKLIYSVEEPIDPCKFSPLDIIRNTLPENIKIKKFPKKEVPPQSHQDDKKMKKLEKELKHKNMDFKSKSRDRDTKTEKCNERNNRYNDACDSESHKRHSKRDRYEYSDKYERSRSERKNKSRHRDRSHSSHRYKESKDEKRHKQFKRMSPKKLKLCNESKETRRKEHVRERHEELHRDRNRNLKRKKISKSEDDSTPKSKRCKKSSEYLKGDSEPNDILPSNFKEPKAEGEYGIEKVSLNNNTMEANPRVDASSTLLAEKLTKVRNSTDDLEEGELTESDASVTLEEVPEEKPRDAHAINGTVRACRTRNEIKPPQPAKADESLAGERATNTNQIPKKESSALTNHQTKSYLNEDAPDSVEAKAVESSASYLETAKIESSKKALGEISAKSEEDKRKRKQKMDSRVSATSELAAQRDDDARESANTAVSLASALPDGATDPEGAHSSDGAVQREVEIGETPTVAIADSRANDVESVCAAAISQSRDTNALSSVADDDPSDRMGQSRSEVGLLENNEEKASSTEKSEITFAEGAKDTVRKSSLMNVAEKIATTSVDDRSETKTLDRKSSDAVDASAERSSEAKTNSTEEKDGNGSTERPGDNPGKQLLKLLVNSEITIKRKVAQATCMKSSPSPPSIKAGNIIIVKRRRKPVQLSDSPPVVVVTSMDLNKSKI